MKTRIKWLLAALAIVASVGTADAVMRQKNPPGDYSYWENAAGDTQVIGRHIVRVVLDVGTANTVAARVPINGTVTAVYSTLHTAATGTQARILAVYPLASPTTTPFAGWSTGTAQGAIGSSTGLTQVVTENAYITIESDGVPSNTPNATIEIHIDPKR